MKPARQMSSTPLSSRMVPALSSRSQEAGSMKRASAPRALARSRAGASSTSLMTIATLAGSHPAASASRIA